MRPILFEWRGVRIWSYPACLCLGVCLGIVAQNVAANAAGLDSWRVYSATLLLLPIALIGARLLYVVVGWRLYVREPRRIWGRSEGGMAMLGAIPCMLLASIPVLAWLSVEFWAFWDVSIFCILVGMAVTRVGCLLNGCCCGRASLGPLAFELPDEHGVWTRRIPTQIVEMALSLLLFAAAVAIWPLFSTTGALFLLVASGYGAGRMILQPFRAERERARGLDVQRALSALLVVWSLSAFAYRSLQDPPPGALP